jgi:hypothetical protein
VIAAGTIKALFTLTSAFSLVLASLAGSTNETANASSDSLQTCEYKIKFDAFVRSLKELASANPNNLEESNQALLVRYFRNNQVVVEKPGSVLLDEKGNRLLIRTTKTQQEEIRKLFQLILTNTTLPRAPAYAIADTNLSECPPIAFTGAPANRVLQIYREFMDAQMDIELPPEALNARITLNSEPKTTRSETARLIENALREQAGIVVARVDAKHLKVTFDDTVKRKEEK